KVKIYELEDEFTQRLLGNVAPINYNIKETKVKVFEKNVEDKMAKYSFAEIGSKYEGGLVLEPNEFDITDLDKLLNEFLEILKMPIKDLITYLDTLDNNIKLTFDEQNLLVYYELKNQFETEVKDETYRRIGINNPDIVNLTEFDNVKEEVEDTITSSAYIIFSFTSDEESKKYQESDNFKYIINREAMRQYRDWIKPELEEFNICFDIWYQIFSYLTFIEQAKLRITCKLFNVVCSSYDINEEIHGFYEFVKESKVLIYRFKLTKDKKYIWIKNGDRMDKRELFRNKEVNYCCGGVNQISILNICDLDKVEELHMKYCDYCTDLNYCC
ncbi:8188_t:CDS:2, partial [Scutellospora calospora]